MAATLQRVLTGPQIIRRLQQMILLMVASNEPVDKAGIVSRLRGSGFSLNDVNTAIANLITEGKIQENP